MNASPPEIQAPALPLLGNPIASFDMGVQLDWRFRIVCDLIKNSGLPLKGEPERDATYILALAERLVDGGLKAGWIQPPPDSDELPEPVRAHARRAARMNAVAQHAGQTMMRDEAPRLEQPQLVPRQPINGKN